MLAHGRHNSLGINLAFLVTNLADGTLGVSVGFTPKLFQHIFVAQEQGQFCVVQHVSFVLRHADTHVETSGVIGIGTIVFGPLKKLGQDF